MLKLSVFPSKKAINKKENDKFFFFLSYEISCSSKKKKRVSVVRKHKVSLYCRQKIEFSQQSWQKCGEKKEKRSEEKRSLKREQNTFDIINIYIYIYSRLVKIDYIYMCVDRREKRILDLKATVKVDILSLIILKRIPKIDVFKMAPFQGLRKGRAVKKKKKNSYFACVSETFCIFRTPTRNFLKKKKAPLLKLS